MRSHHVRVVVLLLLLTVGGFPGSVVRAAAAVTPAQRCTALRIDATARAAVAHVACHVRALRQGKPVKPTCHGDVDTRLDAAFARIEGRGGCPFLGVLPDAEAEIDALVEVLLTAVPESRCGAAKLHAASRKAFGELACRRVGVRRVLAPDADCRARVAARFQQAFATAERRLACDPVGDAAAIAALVDAFVSQVAAHLVEGPDVVDPAPTSLAAAVDGGDIDLTWSAPAPASGNTHVRVLRRLNAAPTDPSDGQATVVFFGTAQTAPDALTALLPTVAGTPRVYHYAAFGCTAGGDCESVGSRTTLAPTLVQALRGGGYVLHWRHSAADVCSDNLGLGTAATTMVPDWWKSCDANCGVTATARQLNAAGVMEATAIGQYFDARAIAIGRVLSSEYCRNVGTAVAMDFGPAIEERTDITFFVYDEAGRCAASYALFAEAPAAGTNTAVIGHAGFSSTCPVLGSLAWSEAAIFKPDGAGGSLLVTRVLWDAWAGMP